MRTYHLIVGNKSVGAACFCPTRTILPPQNQQQRRSSMSHQAPKYFATTQSWAHAYRTHHGAALTFDHGQWSRNRQAPCSVRRNCAATLPQPRQPLPLQSKNTVIGMLIKKTQVDPTRKNHFPGQTYMQTIPYSAPPPQPTYNRIFRPVTHPARTATPAKTQKAGPFVHASAAKSGA